MQPVPSTVIVGANIIDGTGTDPERGTVEISHGLISMKPYGTERPGGHDGHRIDLAGYTLLPGLIDAHTHLGIVGNKNDPGLSLAEVAGQIFANGWSALEAGFTTVRDLGGLDGGMRRAFASCAVPCPRLLPSGPIICETGGNGDLLPAHESHRGAVQGVPGLSTISAPCSGEDDVRRAARLALLRGATQLKVSATTLDGDSDDTELTTAEMRAAVEEAQAKGTYVTAHTLNPGGIKNGLAAGITCFEHGGVDDEATAMAMKAAGAVLVPTLSPEWHAYLRDRPDDDPAQGSHRHHDSWGRRIRQSLSIACSAGVLLGLGSDLEGPDQRGRGIELALRALVQDPMSAITAATRNNAMIIGQPRLGTIEEGQIADLIAVRHDPLQDPDGWSDASNVVMVIVGGRVVKDLLGAVGADSGGPGAGGRPR